MITTYLDLETACLAQEIGGWTALKEQGGGGIPALVTISEADMMRYSDAGVLQYEQGTIPHPIQLWDDATLEGCIDYLETIDRLITFNGIEFDIPVLSARAGRRVNVREHVDILQLIWKALGKRQKGYKLNDLAQRMLGRTKLYCGTMAPQLAREGRFAELFQYCMNDVELTRDLWHTITDSGCVIRPDGGALEVWKGTGCEQEA